MAIQPCKRYRPTHGIEVFHHGGASACEGCVYFSPKNCMQHNGGAFLTQAGISGVFD